VIIVKGISFQGVNKNRGVKRDSFKMYTAKKSKGVKGDNN